MFASVSRSRFSRHARTLAVCLVCAFMLPVDALASLDIAPGQTAMVTGTDGDPINLRAKPNTDALVLTTVGEGDVVDVIAGPMQDDSGMWWYKVMVNGTRAYISADFLSYSGSSSTPAGTVTGSATIVNTGGDSINCRAGAGSEYSVVGSFTEGDTVKLTGERDGPWQPVNCAGQGGFVHTDFLAYGDGDFSDSTAKATIVNTGGDAINCRARANRTATVLTVFYEGDRVSLAGNLVNTWQPVTCAGQTGYVKKTYLSVTNGDGGSGGGGSTVTGHGVVANTSGQGVNCRASGSLGGQVLAVISEGTTVDLRGSASNGWQPVVCSGMNGFISADFIEIGSAPQPPGSTSGLQPGDDAVVANPNGDGVRLRSGASSDSAVITILPENEPVVVGHPPT